VAAADSTDSGDRQLQAVRARIKLLQSRVADLDARQAGAQAERQKLNAELELAEARVTELELLLTASRDEAIELRAEAARLGQQIEERRLVLARHLEMMALLGRPGPLQMIFDAAQGGELEEAMTTVAVLTDGQARLMEEFRSLQQERTSRLAALSRVLETAQREAEQLLRLRHELEDVREKVDQRLRELGRSRQTVASELAELKEREQALERLLGVLASRDRMPDAEDIRRFRGALPWPAEGRIVQTFGKHYLPKYATYTVCNGIRLDVAERSKISAVFPGEVAYAREFKGYGNMVVLDHGNDVYSLVAGLATISVRLNQRVQMGANLGYSPAPSDEGNLYFEIRIGKNPADPKRWLQLAGGAS
jgi:septal ring factor EnvC (AmiA/AmiB activator)